MDYTEMLGEDTEITPWGRDAESLARVMLEEHDLGKAAKVLDMPYSKAWRLYRSPNYAQARYSMIAGIDTEKMDGLKGRVVVRLLEEAHDFVDGSAGSRTTALSKLADVLGLTKAQEHKLTVDTAPGINISLVPANVIDDPDVQEAEIIETDDGES